MKKLIILVLVCIPIGMFAQASTEVFKVKNIKVNSTYDDSRTTTLLADNKVAFTSPNIGLTFNNSEFFNKTLLESNRDENTENKERFIAKNLLEDPNSYFDNGMVSYSKDGKTVFFSVNRKIKNHKRKNEKAIKIKRAVNLQLFKASVNENGAWVNLEMLPFNSNRFSTGQPTLNKDDTKLYFVSDGPESLGRTDIFVVDLHKDGSYGKPVNLGPKINSTDREIFPFIDKNDLLYFSSDASNKKGDLDVFVSKIFDNTVSTPLKTKGQLNIVKDEITYSMDDEKHIGYFSSDKQVGSEINDRYTSIDPVPLRIDCQQDIFGIVKNADSQKLLPNVKIVLFNENNMELSSFLSNEMDASFSFKQTCNTSYKLKGYLDGYLIGELDIKTVNDLNATPLEIVMNMRLESGTESDLIVNTKAIQSKGNDVEKAQVSESNHSPVFYDFNSDKLVYTVQIGAFQGKVQADKFIELSSLFNHFYSDGFNRYYSGVFESRVDAVNYLKLLKKDGYIDSFIVGLKGKQRRF